MKYEECPHGIDVSDVQGCFICEHPELTKEELTKLLRVQLKIEHSPDMTPHQFSCAILEKLNANIKVETVEVRTLCLMVQEQATQLRTIREVTNQGVRSGRVVV